MDFSCDRCGKRYSTDVEPVPGRVYRIPCRCGSTIVVQKDAPPAPAAARARDDEPDTTPRVPFPRHATHGAAAARAEPLPVPPAPVASRADAPVADDPFVPARRGSAELRVLLASAPRDVTPTQVRPPLARRDPDAWDDVSGPLYAPDAENPFVDELRRTRARGLAFGAAVGVPVGALLAVATISLVARLAAAPPSPSAEAPVPEPVAVPVAAPAPVAVAAPAPSRRIAPAAAPAAVPSRPAAPPPAAPPRHPADSGAPERASSSPDPLELEPGAASDGAEAAPVDAPAAREETAETPAAADTSREPAVDREGPAVLDRPQDDEPADAAELER